MGGQPYIDPASLTWDGQHQCWVWSSPSGPRYYRPDFSEEYNRAQMPRKGRPTRQASVQMYGHTGTWNVRPEVLVPLLRSTAAVVTARYEELEAARRAIQVRRQAEQAEGVVAATECANCGAPPPARGQPCRYCGTVAPG